MTQTIINPTPKDYKSEVKPTWCPGCGDFGVLNAAYRGLAALKLSPEQTVVVMDNEIYGLTKGQTSPTSPHGHVTKSTPYGLLASQFNPIATALSLNVSFVARGYSAKPKDLAALIEQGMLHHGFSFIHALSPCPTFYNTFDAWDASVTPLPADHDSQDRIKALTLAMDTERQYMGIFYEEERPTMDQAAQQLAQQGKEFEIDKYMSRYA